MKEKKKLPLALKIILIVLAVILIAVLGVVLYANDLYGRMNVEKKEDIVLQEETFERTENTDNLEEIAEEQIVFNDADHVKATDDVVNILLAGVEGMHDDEGRGRTDSIMIMSLCKEEKALKLTSILRDSYVQIPGHSNNKINAAYNIGGMPLLVDTIEQNFDIKIDGYIMVGFDGFEAIIDYLGGVKIKISQKEAQYLNTTDYIDNYWNQNLYAGTVLMNGDQALGYARVRYVETGNLYGDFGRTKRHRNIINAIFEKLKKESLVNLLGMMPDLMPYVTTNLTRAQCVTFLTDFGTVRPKVLEMNRIPNDDVCKIGRVNGMSVMIVEDFRKNNKDLKEFIYGKSYLQKGKVNPDIMAQ